MRYGVSAFALLFLLAAPVQAHQNLTNGRLTLVLASEAFEPTKTGDRVDQIVWFGSDGSDTFDYVARSEMGACGDPQEFFGQSYGGADGSPLVMVAQGTVGKFSDASDVHVTVTTTGKDDCVALSGKTTTNYSLFAAKAKNSAAKIERSFKFAKIAQSQNFDLRAYVPRLPDAKYRTILYPNAAGAVQVLDVFNCPFAASCTISDWNGVWFADDDGTGNGMAVIRDPSSTSPARLAGDFDSFSNSNATSILLTRPASGWKRSVTETEYLCFYDAKSWTAKQRSAGRLPKGCQVR